MAFAAPDDCSNRRCGTKFAKDVEQLLVHVVREGISLLLVVVRDDGDWAIDLESDLSGHGSPCGSASGRSLAEHAESVERIASGECVRHT
ncbi:unannotated protein [freshwater metagenome]|uniref:Unannotated protein n=1 Tax=freshwater metagenome TaxID=449393 RepID=A0A6J7IEK6_9ZZZZ